MGVQRLPLERAVAVADALFRSTGAPVESLAAVVDAHPGVRGRRRAVLVVPLVDPRAESPRESIHREREQHSRDLARHNRLRARPRR